MRAGCGRMKGSGSAARLAAVGVMNALRRKAARIREKGACRDGRRPSGLLDQASVTAAYAGAPEPVAAAGARLGFAAARSRNGASITARSCHR